MLDQKLLGGQESFALLVVVDVNFVVVDVNFDTRTRKPAIRFMVCSALTSSLSQIINR